MVLCAEIHMTQKQETPAISFRDEFPCSYFSDGRVCTLEYLFPDSGCMHSFHEFLARGYRRQGTVFYRTVCRECAACKPLRLETERFRLSRSQKRTVRMNAGVSVRILPHPALTREKIELYKKYQKTKHGDPDRGKIREYEMILSGLHYGYPSAVEMNYSLGDALIGVGIVDEGEDALSSNYFYYDTDHLDLRLGVYSILREITLAQEMGKIFYYLGFYIEENEKMAYKKFFRPNQVLEGGKWKALW